MPPSPSTVATSISPRRGNRVRGASGSTVTPAAMAIAVEVAGPCVVRRAEGGVGAAPAPRGAKKSATTTVSAACRRAARRGSATGKAGLRTKLTL